MAGTPRSREKRRVLLSGLFMFLVFSWVASPVASGVHRFPAEPSAAHATLQSISERFVYSQVHMGMQVRLVLYAADEEAARHAAAAAFAEVERLDGIFSDYRRDSEVTRLAQAAGSTVVLSNELAIVLDRALGLAEETGGAFDPTAGPLTALWRNAIRSGQLPADELIVETTEQIGWNRVLFDSKRHVVELTRAGMRLDLGAIAKGFILDRALETLREHGIKSAMAEAGGDVVATSAPPGRDGWRVALPHPGACTINIVDAAVSTSGDTEQFVEVA